MWQIGRNCLPTCVRLKEKGVSFPMNCTLYTVDIEDTLHLFFQCPSSLNVWSMLLSFLLFLFCYTKIWIARILFSKHYMIYLRKMRLYFAVCCGVSRNKETTKCGI